MISSTLLLGINANSSPLYDFRYSYYSESSTLEEASGTHFFKPIFPEIAIQGVTDFGKYGLIWGLETPYVSEKYKRGINFNGTVYQDFPINRKMSLRLSISFSSLAREKIFSCIDEIGRRFHCYHGVSESSPFFFYSFEDVKKALYRQRRSFSISQFSVIFSMNF